MKVDLSELPSIENGNNFTLDLPLIETKNKELINQSQKFQLTSVDVEAYHIKKGIQNCEKFIKNI